MSTYSIWAPFDGTILDRELMVPGVAVDTTHRIFTLANLATVWVEASVHEGDFAVLDRTRSRGGKVRFRSPAYPDRVFEGEVIYTAISSRRGAGRSNSLPGQISSACSGRACSSRSRSSARGCVGPADPDLGILADGSSTFVYVKTGSDRFDRREVDAEAPRGDTVIVRGGLSDGDEVIVEGGAEAQVFGRWFGDRASLSLSFREALLVRQLDHILAQEPGFRPPAARGEWHTGVYSLPQPADRRRARHHQRAGHRPDRRPGARPRRSNSSSPSPSKMR